MIEKKNRSQFNGPGIFLQARQTKVYRTMQTLEAAARTFESMARLLGGPGQHSHRVIAVTEYVIARRKTVLGAIDFHLVKLLHIKLVIAHYAPVMRRRIHRETRRERTVGANNQRILPRATLPGWHFPAHQQFHVF